MNLLIIVTKGEVGGAQMSVLNLAKKLQSLGHSVTVGYGEGEFLPAELTKFQIKNVRFSNLKRTINPLKNLVFIWELKSFLDHQPQDAVHFNSSNSLFGAIGAKMSRSNPKTVFTYRGLSLLDQGYEASPITKLIFWAYFWIMDLFIDHSVFVSNRNNLAISPILLARHRSVIYNGLPEDITFKNKADARAELEKILNVSLAEHSLVGSIGRLAYPKNYEFIISNWSKIKQRHPLTKLIIIGSGQEEEKYRRLINENQLAEDIFLAGNLANASVLMRAFDVFTLVSKYEGLSITLIEAITAGRPILCSRVGGNSESVDYDERQLFDLDNPEEFLDKLSHLLSDEKLREEISQKNISYAKNFTISKTAQKYLEIYEKNS